MSHLEGPVVDAFYEVALHSWYNKLDPPLPCLAEPYQPPKDSHGQTRYLFQDENPFFDDVEILKAARAARLLLRRQTKDLDALKTHDENGLVMFRDAVQKVVDRQRQHLADWKPGEELNIRAQIAFNELRDFRDRLSMGMVSRPGSRAGSRAPSRRSSTDFHLGKSEFTRSFGNDYKLIPGYTDKETADITAMNAAVTAPLSNSPPPSSITAVGDTPASPKHKRDEQERADNVERGRKGHVLFLDTDAIDGQGRFMDEDLRESPHSATRSKNTRTASPRGGHLPPAEIKQVAPTSTGGDSLAPPLELSTLDTRALSPSTGASILGAPTVAEPENLAGEGVMTPRDIAGAALPLTAQMPHEIDRSTSRTRQTEEIPLSALPPHVVAEIEESSPDSLNPPEGTGSRRMFQLSKKFSEHLSPPSTRCARETDDRRGWCFERSLGYRGGF